MGKRTPTTKPDKNEKKPLSSPDSRTTLPGATLTSLVRDAADSTDGSTPSSSFSPVTVTIRTDTGAEIRFQTSEAFQQAAMQWSYVLRNRRRWISQQLIEERLAQRITQTVYSLFEKDEVDPIIGSSILEVCIPSPNDEAGEEARIFPWEYVLSAVRQARRSQTTDTELWKPLTVIRHLACQDDSIGPPPVVKPCSLRLLVVQSTPQELGDEYNVEEEGRLIASSLGLKPNNVRHIIDPSRERLKREVMSFAPHVIHLAGCDNYQATSVVPALRHRTPVDGMILSTEQGFPDPVPADDLADLVNAATEKPLLVTCNFWNSAARIAPSIVRKGAVSAIGFQDEIDDAVAENFFAGFYSEWVRKELDTLKVFRRTLKRTRDTIEDFQGTGVVLWSRRSLVTDRRERHTAAEASNAPPPPGDADADAAAAAKPLEEITFENTIGRRARDLLSVDVQPHDAFNYSLLHNNQGLFKTFVIRVHDPRISCGGGVVRGVKVETVLYVGNESFPCLLTCDLVEPSTHLDPRIRVALTSAMTRGLREVVHTSLYLRVEWQNEEVFRDTRRVSLLPIDEWVDEQKQTNRNWLPSFVLPRDPVILRIIDSAQRYLMTLVDDSAAGFDSYQSVGACAGEDRTAVVDMQVRAIWAALVQDYLLSYVNPPPVYSKSSQRLRTPSDVIEGKRGTCIDLALLLASCLEYVDIYPVIFLLRGHAFVGYWRDCGEYEKFADMQDMELLKVSANQMDGTRARAQPWLLDNDSYELVLSHVQAGTLVPLEATLLTRHGSFREAMQQGANNLASRSEFDSMVDIVKARRRAVTPLPLEWRVMR
jgi:hypothetical protein